MVVGAVVVGVVRVVGVVVVVVVVVVGVAVAVAVAAAVVVVAVSSSNYRAISYTSSKTQPGNCQSLENFKQGIWRHV